MKIYDCFTFLNELDLLEIRLNELNDVVDYFVLVESKKTWQNNTKSCIFLDNQDRFKQFLHKIIRVPQQKCQLYCLLMDFTIQEDYLLNQIHKTNSNHKINDYKTLGSSQINH